MQVARIVKKSIRSMTQKYKRLDKDEVVKNNLGLVCKLARKYERYYGVEYDDLVQEGCIGLLRAREKYNPKKGKRFSTYAYHWIRSGMLTYIQEKTRIIRLPRNVAAKDMTGEKGNHKEPVSLDAPLYDEADSVSIQEVIADPLDMVKMLESVVYVSDLVKKLRPREQEIVRLRYGLEGVGPMKLDEISNVYGFGKQRVYQILNKSLKKLAKIM